MRLDRGAVVGDLAEVALARARRLSLDYLIGQLPGRQLGARSEGVTAAALAICMHRRFEQFVKSFRQDMSIPWKKGAPCLLKS